MQAGRFGKIDMSLEGKCCWKIDNRPFYRYGGRIELIGFKEYYGMPRGHEHDLIYLHQYLRALLGTIFL